MLLNFSPVRHLLDMFCFNLYHVSRCLFVDLLDLLGGLQLHALQVRNLFSQDALENSQKERGLVKNMVTFTSVSDSEDLAYISD